MSVASRPVHRASLDAIAAAGYEATPVAGCCGALSMHHGHPEAAREMARERIADLEDFDLVVVNAAGCSGHVKDYGELLDDDPEWAERAARVAARACDVVELDYAVRRGSPGPVAVHDACHHLNGQGIADEPRRLLTRAGAELRELGDGGRCCGAAGLYAVTQPEMSARLRRQKAEAIAATGAPVVSVANAGCAMQIERGLAEVGSETRVAHPTEIARASRL
jgi:glycolate oxidase iron-sulfur subunit